MGLGSRAWFALMRRNLLYRRRYWISSILELLLPMLFILLLVWIRSLADAELKGDTKPATFPTESNVFRPLSFRDYTIAMEAQRVCLDVEQLDSSATVEEPSLNRDDLAAGLELYCGQCYETDVADTDECKQADLLGFGVRYCENDEAGKQALVDSLGEQFGIPEPPPPGTSFRISGYSRFQWMVPFLICDSDSCTQHLEDANPYCERRILGLVGTNGGSARVESFIQYLQLEFNISDTFYRIFDDKDDSMDKYVTSRDYGFSLPKIALGIEFDGTEFNNWKYSIRPNSTNFNIPDQASEPVTPTTPPTSKRTSAFAKGDDVCGGGNNGQGLYQGRESESCTGQYMYNGVLTMQRVVQDFILNQTGTTTAGYGVAEAGVSFVPFPTPEFTEDSFFASIQDFLPIIIILGMLYPVASMISYLVKEKDYRQKELMKMMSVTEADLGWSWFITFLMFHTFTATFATWVSTIFYRNASTGWLWIFWMVTVISFICYCMVIASLTSKPTRAVLLGVLVFLCGVFLTLAVDYEDGKTSTVQLISLHPVSAFAYGLKQIGRLEEAGVGLTSNTLTFSENPSGYSFLDSIWILLFDSLLWGCLAWYLNRVIPPAYGQAMPIWFPFTTSYWFPSRVSTNETDSTTVEEKVASSNIPYEPVSAALKRQATEGASIEIHNLVKHFGEKTAVDGLNLSMYAGQITALLGHNGAGKTTTINMLTGAMGPTSGYATVAGQDIRTDLSAIRKDIGICLQHDCLFPDLTVREHVQFFARLKGLYETNTPAEAERQIDQAIRDVALFEKRNSQSKTLSGGMKRKLSVAIAFCGGSKVVLLDEPTSGMDPFSRRFTWNVIRQYRQDRCIILTTHFMDEADILGDRIAIMADGQLRCAGGPLFLKKTYGVGYQLTIEKKADSKLSSAEAKVTAMAADGDDADKVAGDDIESPSAGAVAVADPLASPEIDLVETMKNAIPEATLLSDVGTELKFQLPLGASSKFPGMFSVLDQQAQHSNIVTYGVSMTTLDEVFLLVARGDAAKDGSKQHLASSRRLGSMNGEDEANRSSRSKMNLEKNNLFGKHLTALFKKRAANFRRDKRSWVCTTLVPSVFVLTGLLVGKFVGPPVNQDPLALDLSSFNSGVGSSPIGVNAPDSTFMCQPGICLNSQNDINVPQTNENYIFCGERSLLANPTNANETLDCSISESGDILSTLNGFQGAEVFETELGDIRTASRSLHASAGTTAASQYGAIWFARDSGSSTVISNTSLDFNSLVSEQCRLQTVTNYTTAEDCDRFRGVGYVVQYNFTGLHTGPMLQALADQALVRYATNNPDFVISSTIAPLPITRLETGFSSAADTTFTWFLMMLSFPFIGGAFATFIVNERQSKAKHLQTVAGVEPVAYWVSTFLWDTMNYQIPLWITVALMFIFDVKVLTTSERDVFSGILALMFCFGPAFAGFCYCISFMFKSASLCQVAIVITGFIVAFVGSLAVFILILVGGLSGDDGFLEKEANIVIWCCRLFPTFCLGKGLLFTINIEILTFLEQDPNLSVWSSLILKDDVIVLIVQSFVYLGLAIVLDTASGNPAFMNIFNQVFRCQFLSKDKGGGITTALPEDSDVLEEQRRVDDGEANDDLIVISNLTKLFGNGKLAVNNMSLGIAPGECFGLLGINGAGKTTTMGMLTAEFPPSSGDATLAGISIVKEPQKIRRRIGYCPQFDAHFANMTGREHVELYAAIKGVPSKSVQEAAAAKLKEVGLNDFDADRLCSKYSGGMKRRLSLACATIGQPQLVFLDECSTGVDPVARREIWQMVSDMVSGGGSIPDQERTSVVLTTHSMEECEALCPRIGIMANGRLRCLGSAQHLKTKFGQGYQVELKALIPTANDQDYVHNASVLARSKVGGNMENGAATGLTFNLMEVTNSLRMLTNDDFLSGMIQPQSPNGYTVWKDANTPTGVTLETLATFATGEIRLRKVAEFLTAAFPKNLLREQQDLKVRYEVSAEGVKISDIFSKIEASKDVLHLADYGVSQTSLEQVFNMHAAEAEKLKQGRDDH